jgi:hypothetical protein
MVAKFGFNCGTVLSVAGNDCDRDLSTFHAEIPKGVTPAQLCPKSCARCKDASGHTAPLPERVTDTFINGHLISPAERSWLQGLGVQFPPGRYFIETDGSAGVEGGPVVMNVYAVAGQHVGTAIEQAIRETGVSQEIGNAQSFTIKTGEQAQNGINDVAQASQNEIRDIISLISTLFG